MKVVVIGGTGLIGSKVVTRLSQQGHEAVAAAPNTGVNTLTGEGLDAALEGASVVVDVANSPSFEDAAAMEFFQTSTSNVLTAAPKAGVGHYVALSVVGTERLPASGYFRAKVAQERLIASSGVPYTLVHATQFFEFLDAIALSSTDGDTVHIAPVDFQPIAADDVADVVSEVAVGPPLNDRIEIAGPDRYRFDELIRALLRGKDDPRDVVTDPQAPYFGAELGQESLVPSENPRLGQRHLREWLVS
ncbi:MAG TPA: SDR family oxidoreductase [Candidatus Limnocylindrales bacterium]|nr:SDR family oxidoreductase [Candidatus Limnocylindrales bacterium]